MILEKFVFVLIPSQVVDKALVQERGDRAGDEE